MNALVSILLILTAPHADSSAGRGYAPVVSTAHARVSVGGFQRRGERWRSQVIRVEGTFSRSLYTSLADALPDSLLNARERSQMAWELADLFRWEADFTRDLRAGEPYSFLFERLVDQDGEVRFGRMLAAELTVAGRALEAYEFDGPNGETSYYDGQGVSMRRSFLRVPVEFKRISAEFSSARFHPILKYWRKHEGIDYAAAPGSPVMSVGEGTVARAGWYGGYGRLVEVSHANGVVTRYGHLKGFARGLAVGARVAQGQCLGYVGATGLATGPHLHFEFRINGAATDPRIALAEEPGQPIGPDLAERFARNVAELRSDLHPNSSFASAALGR
jgi:murein DD-endopeptidase MepM/ murein hydrolase activator NlpD